jgi:sec-independent protein translocase protein TatB
MFDIGFWEIMLILVLALVVIGPERLPGAARKAGYLVGKVRRYIEGVRSEVESEIDVSEFKRMLRNQEVQIHELQQQLKSGVDDIKHELPDTHGHTQGDIMTDVPSHSFHDEAPEQPAADQPAKNTRDTSVTDESETDKTGSDKS